MSRETIKNILDRLDALGSGSFPISFDDGTYTYSITAGAGTMLQLEVSVDADPTNKVTLQLEGDTQGFNLFIGNGSGGIGGGLYWAFGGDPSSDGANLFADAGVHINSSTGPLSVTTDSLGFFGNAPVGQQAALTLLDVIAALQAYGLLS